MENKVPKGYGIYKANKEFFAGRINQFGYPKIASGLDGYWFKEKKDATEYLRLLAEAVNVEDKIFADIFATETCCYFPYSD
jgi:hypothetical protein